MTDLFPKTVLLGALLCSLASAEDRPIRIFEDRFTALAEARETCQPLVLHFYNAEIRTYIGRNRWISPQERIRLFYSGSQDIRDKALQTAVVLLLPMTQWRGAASDLGVLSEEGLASLSPFELAAVDANSRWGGLVFR